MSEKEKEQLTASAPTDSRKGPFKKIALIVVVLALVGGAGGGGFYYWRSSALAAEANPGKKASDKKSKKVVEENETAPAETESSAKSNKSVQTALPEDEDVKKIIEVPPFIVNLADTEQARYLRMTVSLGVGGETESEKPDQLFLTRVRSAMLAVLSDKKSDEILSVDGKNKLRKELLSAAQTASEDPEVKAIYITDFIVQL